MLVKLKNSSMEVASLVAITMVSLQGLLKAGKAIVVYELVQLCRNREHKPWGKTGEDLKDLALVTCVGDQWQVHNSIRNIVLSATSGEGLDIVVNDPVASK